MIPLTAVEDWTDSLPAAARPDAVKRLKDLARETIARRVQFLCGAGMSKASGGPLSTEVGERIVKRLLFGDEEATGGPAAEAAAIASTYVVETLAEAYEYEHKATELNRLINWVVAGKKGKPHAGHKSLEFLANHGYINQVYTTNFDTLIEEGLGERAATITDTDAHLDKYLSIRNGASVHIPVLHLHGVAGGECRFVESTTYELDTPLAKLLSADMVTHSFVWVGYSLTDLDVRRLFLILRDMLSRHRRTMPPFVVHPLLTKPELQEHEWRVADLVWKARHCYFVPGRAETLLPALVAQIRRSKSENLIRALVEKAGGDPTNADEVDKKTRDIVGVSVDAGISDFDQTVEDVARQEGVL